jgi:glycerol transport system permease protein
MKPRDDRAWLFLIPSLAVMMLVGIVPLVTVFNYSVLDIFTLEQVFWVGTEWYRDIVSSEDFLRSLARSLLFSALVIAVQFPLGIWLALVVSGAGRLRIVAMMLLALPLVVPWNMIPIMWLNLIDPQDGTVGRALVWLGVDFDYKFNALHTWIVLVVMDTWHWLGLVTILATAGLSGIQPAYYQAAAVDGASRWAVFRFIQLPKIAGVLSIALLLRFVDSFMIYTEAFRINAGGPDGATTFLSLQLGEEIKSFNYGPAAARAMISFLMVLTIAWVFKASMDRRGDGRQGGLA